MVRGSSDQQRRGPKRTPKSWGCPPPPRPGQRKLRPTTWCISCGYPPGQAQPDQRPPPGGSFSVPAYIQKRGHLPSRHETTRLQLPLPLRARLVSSRRPAKQRVAGLEEARQRPYACRKRARHGSWQLGLVLKNCFHRSRKVRQGPTRSSDPTPGKTKAPTRPGQTKLRTPLPDQVRQTLRPAPWLFLVAPPTAEIRAQVETAGSPEMEACLRDDTHSSSESMTHRARGATSPRARELSAVSALMMEMVMIPRGKNCGACVRSRSLVLFEVSMVIVRAMIR